MFDRGFVTAKLTVNLALQWDKWRWETPTSTRYSSATADPRKPPATTGYCTNVFFDAAMWFIGNNRDRRFFVTFRPMSRTRLYRLPTAM